MSGENYQTDEKGDTYAFESNYQFLNKLYIYSQRLS